jgi:hypothetical protein
MEYNDPFLSMFSTTTDSNYINLYHPTLNPCLQWQALPSIAMFKCNAVGLSKLSMPNCGVLLIIGPEAKYRFHVLYSTVIYFNENCTETFKTLC